MNGETWVLSWLDWTQKDVHEEQSSQGEIQLRGKRSEVWFSLSQDPAEIQHSMMTTL